MRTDPAKLEMMRSYFNAIASGMDMSLSGRLLRLSSKNQLTLRQR